MTLGGYGGEEESGKNEKKERICSKYIVENSHKINKKL